VGVCASPCSNQFVFLAKKSLHLFLSLKSLPCQAKAKKSYKIFENKFAFYTCGPGTKGNPTARFIQADAYEIDFLNCLPNK